MSTWTKGHRRPFAGPLDAATTLPLVSAPDVDGVVVRPVPDAEIP